MDLSFSIFFIKACCLRHLILGIFRGFWLEVGAYPVHDAAVCEPCFCRGFPVCFFAFFWLSWGLGLVFLHGVGVGFKSLEKTNKNYIIEKHKELP